MPPARLLALAATALFMTAGCGASRSASSAPTSPPASAAASAPTSTAALTSSPTTPPLVDHVQWVTTSQGARLEVFPTAAGRTAPAADSTQAWAEILADAPNADTPGMHDQFQCHWTFARVVAPDKSSWNLEPWRPAVGYAATVAASCNPGGPED